jgi:proline iminopeptidase
MRVADGYFDQSGRGDVLSGGVKMIPISTPKGGFRVWTKRVGNNPNVKVLLLHGGPGATHEYFEACDSYFPAAGIEYYYYDQLGSTYSDQPDDPDLWEIPRFVDEVEQVRQALGLDSSNFYLFGQSWGGALAIEYALAHGQHLKGLLISNMMSSIPAYNAYATDVLMPAMDQQALAEIKRLEAAEAFDDPRYSQLLMQHHYVHHVLRMPADDWPDPVTRAFAHINPDIYVPMQGPSELGASGKLLGWDRTEDLPNIAAPTLVIGARYDTMDPRYMQLMASKIPGATYLYCPNGSHLAMYDDQATYFDGIIGFIRKVEAPTAPS